MQFIHLIRILLYKEHQIINKCNYGRQKSTLYQFGTKCFFYNHNILYRAENHKHLYRAILNIVCFFIYSYFNNLRKYMSISFKETSIASQSKSRMDNLVLSTSSNCFRILLFANISLSV